MIVEIEIIPITIEDRQYLGDIKKRGEKRGKNFK